MKTTIYRTAKELNDHNERETYRGDAREVIIIMGNQIIQQREKLNQLENERAIPNIEMMMKQLNDLHTIVMAKPVPSKKVPKEKKPSKKERLNEILAKRAFEAATKSN